MAIQTSRNTLEPFRKSLSMYGALFGLWLVILCWFQPRLIRLFELVDSAPETMLLVALIGCLNIFWLLGLYTVVLSVFTFLCNVRRTVRPPPLEALPEVAILYVTMNDFDRSAALSCVNQDYPTCHVYIVDGSSSACKIAEIDAFLREFGDCVTLRRRQDRTGYKAGALNDVLRTTAVREPFFAVIDADGVVPRDFLSRLMPYFGLADDIAFVHGSHRPNPVQKSQFSADLALGLTPLWALSFGPRNRYGFVPFLGHGAVVKRNVWLSVGGFPEIVSEDFAFATKACELGFRGYFVRDVISLEDFPESYSQFRRQQEKYVKGGCELIHRHMTSFLRSTRVYFVEKLDAILWLATLFIPLVNLLFIVVFSLFMWRVGGESHTVNISFNGRQLALWWVSLPSAHFGEVFTWDFMGLALVFMFAPTVAAATFGVRNPILFMRLMVASTTAHLSLIVVCSVAVLIYVMTRKAQFWVTGDKEDDGTQYLDRVTSGRFPYLDRVNAGHGAVHVLELGLGLVLSGACVMTLNVSFLAFGVSLILGYFVLQYGWNSPPLAACRVLPLAFLLLAAALLGANLFGAQGAFL